MFTNFLSSLSRLCCVLVQRPLEGSDSPSSDLVRATARRPGVRHYPSGRWYKEDVAARLIEVKALWGFPDAACALSFLTPPGASQCTKLKRDVSRHRGDEIKKATGELMVPRRRGAGAQRVIQLTEGTLKRGTDIGSK